MAWFVCHRHYVERTKTFVLGFVFVLVLAHEQAKGHYITSPGDLRREWTMEDKNVLLYEGSYIDLKTILAKPSKRNNIELLARPVAIERES